MKKSNVVNRIHFKDFYQSVARGMARDNDWSDRHYKDTLAKAAVFSNFAYNGKPVGEHYVDEITAIIIEAFTEWLSREGNTRLKKGVCTATQNRYLSMISLFCKKAVKLEYTPTYPAFSWKTESKGRPRYYSEEEQQKLFEFFRTDETYSKYPWIRYCLTLGLKTGMRLGEIQKLDNGQAEIIKDKDGDELIYIKKGKNGDERYIPIMLDEVAEAAHRIYNSNSFNHHVLYKGLWKAKKLIAPNDPHFNFHVTRHTCASEMANKQNLNLKTIATVLGHRSLNTTTKYVHVSLNATKEALKGRVA
mgnify:CR=1 FL=1